VFHIFGALAEFERNLIVERTKAGLIAARARGRLGGRPPSLDDKQREALLLLYQEKKHSVKEICQIMGISKQTLYNYLRQAEGQKRVNQNEGK
jgi:DNA invertase Pin-like site-specific DNA recombinase